MLKACWPVCREQKILVLEFENEVRPVLLRLLRTANLSAVRQYAIKVGT